VEWNGQLWDQPTTPGPGPYQASPTTQASDAEQQLCENLMNIKLTPLGNAVRHLLDRKTSCWEAMGVSPPKWWLEQQEFKKMYGTDSDSD